MQLVRDLKVLEGAIPLVGPVVYAAQGKSEVFLVVVRDVNAVVAGLNQCNKPVIGLDIFDLHEVPIGIRMAWIELDRLAKTLRGLQRSGPCRAEHCPG